MEGGYCFNIQAVDGSMKIFNFKNVKRRLEICIPTALIFIILLLHGIMIFFREIFISSRNQIPTLKF